MNTKPILFSTEMVQAILAGRKTQTRRIVKIKGSIPNNETKPLSTHSCNSVYHFWSHDEVACPYGSPGDILWVREKHHKLIDCETGKFKRYGYYADMPEKFHKENPSKWKPSIHMPKEACRLFLKVTNVRVERLKHINRKDSFAEGCHFPDWSRENDPQIWFYELWERINGKESLESNPWVWVIEFEKVEKPENF